MKITLLKRMVISLLVVSPLYANDIVLMQQLARDGAPDLALALVDRVQPDSGENIAAWQFFEEHRIKLLRQWEKWQILAQRLAVLPENSSDNFKQTAGLHRAEALLQLKQPEQALAQLRALIWRPFVTYRKQDLAGYQRLLIRAYMLLGQAGWDDALMAVVRYLQDYGDKTGQWWRLRARLALLTAKPHQALLALTGLVDYEAEVLRLLAKLRAGDDAALIISTAREQLAKKALTDLARLRYWLLIAEAGRALQDQQTSVEAMENALLYHELFDREDPLFLLDADQMWAEYRRLGDVSGNAIQLLVGDDDAWHQAAARQKSDVVARAMYIVVFLESQDPANRRRAYQAFSERFSDQSVVGHMLSLLFVQSSQYRMAADIPDFIRYQLIEMALENDDVERAAWLLQNLEIAPEGVDDYDWNLRRARVLILGGRADQGADILQNTLQRYPELEASKVDHLLQVVFDLQTVGADTRAISLLDILLKRPLSVQLQRELYFWLADSWWAQKDLVKAAAYYLKSATLVGGSDHDSWGETARFRAAEVLLQQGMLGDAKRVLQMLLVVTKDKSRLALIRNQLQQIRLRQNYAEP